MRGHDQAERGVAEEGQRVLGEGAGVLGGEGGMGERADQQRTVGEAMAEPIL